MSWASTASGVASSATSTPIASRASRSAAWVPRVRKVGPGKLHQPVQTRVVRNLHADALEGRTQIPTRPVPHGALAGQLALHGTQLLTHPGQQRDLRAGQRAARGAQRTTGRTVRIADRILRPGQLLLRTVHRIQRLVQQRVRTRRKQRTRPHLTDQTQRPLRSRQRGLRQLQRPHGLATGLVVGGTQILPGGGKPLVGLPKLPPQLLPGFPVVAPGKRRGSQTQRLLRVRQRVLRRSRPLPRGVPFGLRRSGPLQGRIARRLRRSGPIQGRIALLVRRPAARTERQGDGRKRGPTRKPGLPSRQATQNRSAGHSLTSQFKWGTSRANASLHHQYAMSTRKTANHAVEPNFRKNAPPPP